SFNVIRQSLAIVLVAFGINYIIQKKFLKYLIVVILATLFHESAIIFICLYFLYGIRLNIKNVLYVIISFIIIFISIDQLINYFVSHSNSLSYLGGSLILDKGSGFLFPLINLFILLFVSYIKLTNNPNKNFDFYFYIVLIGFLNSLISMQAGILLRLNYYFFFLYVIIIPFSIAQIKNKNDRLLLTYIIVTVTLIYFVIRLSQGWH